MKKQEVDQREQSQNRSKVPESGVAVHAGMCTHKCTHLFVVNLGIFSKEALSMYAGVGFSESWDVTEVTIAINRKDLIGNWLMG